jgi:hypothetical protein
MQVPCDPRILIAVLQPEKLSHFNITTVEQEMRQDLILDGGASVSLSLLDTERFAVPDVLPALHPDDAALLTVRHFLYPKESTPAPLNVGKTHGMKRLSFGFVATQHCLWRGSRSCKEQGASARRRHRVVLANAHNLHCK